MTKADKKLTENDQILDPKIEKNIAIFLVFFELKIQKNRYFSLFFFTRELPHPNPIQIRKSRRLRTTPGSLRNWPPAPD